MQKQSNSQKKYIPTFWECSPDNLAAKTEDTETTEYAYSSTGELMSVTLPDGTNITYIQDPNGRRIAKLVNGTIVEKYLWSGLTTLLAVYDGNDNLLQRFEYADGRMPVAMTAGGSRYYFAYDQVGSLRLVTDSAGNIVKQIGYDTFGNILDETNAGFTVPFGFAGGLHDRDTGLVRFGYRDYMPEIGRWTAKDPILFAAGDTNLYGYVGNDPVNFVDPEGEIAVTGTLLLIWGGIEFALSVSDAISTVQTLADPCATGGDKLTAAGLFAAGMVAPGGGGASAVRLKRLHLDPTLIISKLKGIRKKSTDDIIESLISPGKNQLKVRPDGTVIDGNHRIKVLEERGYDTSKLFKDADVIPKESIAPWE